MAGAARAHYVTSIDRIGLAIGAGGALAGIIAAALVAAGGRFAISDLVIGWLLGAVFAMIGVVAVLGPVWLALHIANRRGPGEAAAVSFVLALLLFSAGQTWGFGLFATPDQSFGFVYRLVSALATSVVVAIGFAAIGWVMQRVAYRRIF